MELHELRPQVEPFSSLTVATAATTEHSRVSSPKGVVRDNANENVPRPKKSWRFWLAFVTLCLSSFLSSVDATILATALPPIAEELKGSSILAFWCATSFLLASTVVQPGISTPSITDRCLRKHFRDFRTKTSPSCHNPHFPSWFDYVCAKYVNGNASGKSSNSRSWRRRPSHTG